MKKVRMLFFFIFIITIILPVQQTAQDQKNIIYSVIVMPFYEMEQYPYVMDRVRESLLFELTTKNFNVIQDDSTWFIILDKEYPLYFLNNDQVIEISQEVDADLIIFGNLQNYSTSRPTSFNRTQTVVKPILIKIYDTKKQSIVLHERINLNQKWGLNSRNLSLSDFASTIVNKMKSLGY